MRSQFIARRMRSERAVAVEISERGPDVISDVDAVEGPIRRHPQEPLRVAPADGRVVKFAVRRVGCFIVRVRRLQRAAVWLARKSGAVHRDQQRSTGEVPGSPDAAFSLGAAHRHRRALALSSFAFRVRGTLAPSAMSPRAVMEFHEAMLPHGRGAAHALQEPSR